MHHSAIPASLVHLAASELSQSPNNCDTVEHIIQTLRVAEAVHSVRTAGPSKNIEEDVGFGSVVLICPYPEGAGLPAAQVSMAHFFGSSEGYNAFKADKMLRAHKIWVDALAGKSRAHIRVTIQMGFSMSDAEARSLGQVATFLIEEITRRRVLASFELPPRSMEPDTTVVLGWPTHNDFYAMPVAVDTNAYRYLTERSFSPRYAAWAFGSGFLPAIKHTPDLDDITEFRVVTHD